MLETPKQLKEIVIGEWRQENYIKDDIIDDITIERAISIRVRKREDKIIGIGVTYLDHMGV